MVGLDIETQVEPRECPICGGEAGLLGILGTRHHFTCRNCGMQFSESHEPKETKVRSKGRKKREVP